MATLPTSNNNSMGSNWNQVNGIAKDVENMKRVQSFKDETGVRRVLLGKIGDNSYGLKVSQIGKDVFTAADSDLVFNSNNNVFKIIGTFTVLNPSVSTTPAAGKYDHRTGRVDIPHNFGFKPAILAFIETNDVILPMPYTLVESFDSGNSAFWLDAIVEVEDEKFQVEMNLMSYNSGITLSANDFEIKIYAVQETADL